MMKDRIESLSKRVEHGPVDVKDVLAELKEMERSANELRETIGIAIAYAKDFDNMKVMVVQSLLKAKSIAQLLESSV
jgi:hypothetical protein